MQFFKGPSDMQAMLPSLSIAHLAAPFRNSRLTLKLRGFASSRLLAPRWMTSRWLSSHFGRRVSTLPTMSSSRLAVSPPSLRFAPESAWQRAMLWLMAPSPQAAAQPLLNRIPAVRTDFMATLSDVATDDAEAVRGRIGQARSLRELWHLRADVFRVIGVAHSQSEAEQRVSLLSRHFPAPAPRSQFAAL
jgi:hypothetical protein